MTALAESYLSIGDLVCGPGTAYEILDLDVYSFPSNQDSDTNAPDGFGVILGQTDSWDGKLVTASILVRGGTPETLRAAMDAFADSMVVWRPDDSIVFAWAPPGYSGKTWQYTGRGRKLKWDDASFAMGYATADILFRAADAPRMSTDLHSVTMALPLVSGGATFPATFPETFSGSSTLGSATAVNDGNVPADWVARIDGPVVNPYFSIVDDDGTSYTLRFDITLATGDFLEIDSQSASILLNGTSSRYTSLLAGSAWFPIPPGSHEITFGANSYIDGATLTVSWRDARLG